MWGSNPPVLISGDFIWVQKSEVKSANLTIFYITLLRKILKNDKKENIFRSLYYVV